LLIGDHADCSVKDGCRIPAEISGGGNLRIDSSVRVGQPKALYSSMLKLIANIKGSEPANGG
jgi:hypothetical protein